MKILKTRTMNECCLCKTKIIEIRDICKECADYIRINNILPKIEKEDYGYIKEIFCQIGNNFIFVESLNISFNNPRNYSRKISGTFRLFSNVKGYFKDPHEIIGGGLYCSFSFSFYSFILQIKASKRYSIEIGCLMDYFNNLGGCIADFPKEKFVKFLGYNLEYDILEYDNEFHWYNFKFNEIKKVNEI